MRDKLKIGGRAAWCALSSKPARKLEAALIALLVEAVWKAIGAA